MTRVCFFHEPFDVDVSSGTIHALYQWFELFHAFNVTECAVITEEDLPMIDSNMTVHKYIRIDQFLENQPGKKTFVEIGGEDHRGYIFDQTDWLVFGGSNGLPRADVGINTGSVALYPREAAAIILGSM